MDRVVPLYRICGFIVNGRECATAFFQYIVGCNIIPSMNAARIPE
jgi:hypothetical protein